MFINLRSGAHVPSRVVANWDKSKSILGQLPKNENFRNFAPPAWVFKKGSKTHFTRNLLPKL